MPDYQGGSEPSEKVRANDLRPVKRTSTTDLLWRGVIIALFVIAVAFAIGAPLVTGNWRYVVSAAPLFAFAILIAAIRSIRPRPTGDPG